MNVSPMLLTDLALEVAVGAEHKLEDKYVYALMATHVSEMLENLEGEEAILILASSLVFLLVENFQLQQKVL